MEINYPYYRFNFFQGEGELDGILSLSEQSTTYDLDAIASDFKAHLAAEPGVTAVNFNKYSIETEAV